MATTVMNGNDCFKNDNDCSKWQRPFTKGKIASPAIDIFIVGYSVIGTLNTQIFETFEGSIVTPQKVTSSRNVTTFDTKCNINLKYNNFNTK